jgi:cytochrome c553
MVGLLMAAQPVMAQAPAGGLKGDPAAGARKNSMCIGCHGIPEYKTAFPVLYRVPKIAGQNEAYLVASLQAYKNGDRTHPSMKAISASLTDQDMADLAAFYARQSR